MHMIELVKHSFSRSFGRSNVERYENVVRLLCQKVTK